MITESHIRTIGEELSLPAKQIYSTAMLLSDGGTVPFIARYRKEVTGSLDEVQIAAIRDRMEQLVQLDARRESILKSLKERNILTGELETAVTTALTLTKLEDIYAPYRPKRRTRATIAKEAGLEPLAEILWKQDAAVNPPAEAVAYLAPDKEIDTVEKALAGARDILAERISDDVTAREKIRHLYREKGIIWSKVFSGKETEGAKYKDYFDWNEPLAGVPSHRLLAMRRGEKESILIFRIKIEEADANSILGGLFVTASNPSGDQVRLAATDAMQRLLGPAIEVEMRLESKKRADEESIRVFVENIRELLLSPALGQKTVLAIDPGFRTGCKIVCLDAQGKLLTNCVIYPDKSDSERREACDVIRKLCSHFKIEAIAIGNGTAGRETEGFVKTLGLPPSIQVLMVNESGASIYSASEAAREEFPDQDITVRGSVSIGRRLMDPLAELVKIDPKSIGVGQYQHDVDQPALKRSLDDVVESCVNAVGVEVNTASKQLLAYVSGLGPVLAENIVKYRNENGPFKSRKDLLKVARVGDKAYEQAAGFLRIRGAQNPLDASAVHPESYEIVEAMARDLKCEAADLIRDARLRAKITPERYVTDKAGLPTLKDIISELAKPGRDPRKQFEVFEFAEGVSTMKDLKPGMKLPGIVTNVAAFGAFVDIGVHQDGLVHISQLSDQFVKAPSDVVKVQDRVMVTVMEVDTERKRIALSMKTNLDMSAQPKPGGGGDRRPVGSPAKSSGNQPFNNNPFAQALNQFGKK
ncbi:MAG: Tex family protein [Chthoniobacterales bacterium]